MADSGQAARRALSAPDVVARKGAGAPLVMVTAYDAPSARAVDAAGVDMILVGDSVAMVVLGYDDTLHVTIDDMAHHTGAVARTKPRALVVADLPWMSYHLSRDETVANAAHLVRAGATAVKLEGGRKRVNAVNAILDAEIPVMGHLGLTPQSVHKFGGYRVQGRGDEAEQKLIEDAIELESAGAELLVLEAIPAKLGEQVTQRLRIPTIGIGAGPGCSGQVLVLHDMLDVFPGKKAKFVRNFMKGAASITDAAERYVRAVRDGSFPAEEHSF